jgi:HK97 family phage prohead protease
MEHSGPFRSAGALAEGGRDKFNALGQHERVTATREDPVPTRLSPAFAFKAADVTASGEFSGYASTFGGPPDAYGDIIAEGAFSDSLAQHRSDNTQPALLWSHDPAAPIGRWLDLHEDAKGLAVTGQLTLAVEKAREAHALMKDGALALSIGFRTLDDAFARDGTHVLRAIQLFEISTVALAANARAQITSVRSRPDSLRDYELALRDTLHFSVREARHLATRGWPPSEDLNARIAYWVNRFRS